MKKPLSNIIICININAGDDIGKGGVRIENTILFEKYQLGPMIGKGRSGTVWLATHMKLEERRAIKRVSKDFVGYEQFRREALLLKELRHPGIPIVYDLEEDESYSYLIEEFLEGDSLYDLVRRQGHLNQDAVLRYGVLICDLVQYLHSAGETPILYLDLQPKNLLLCHETVKLIDFDHAADIRTANEDTKRFGTPGYCAPEQMDGGMKLDVRTDVYAIGSILFYMRTGTYPEGGVGRAEDLPHGHMLKMSEKTVQACGRRLLKIISTCMNPQKEARYQSAEEVRAALEDLKRQTTRGAVEIQEPGIGVFSKNKISSLTIALAGSRSGVGTTHLSISLSEYLRHKGYPNLYEEHNRSGAVRQLARYEGVKADSYGIYNIRKTMFKPVYGEAVSLKEQPYGIVVRDYGSDWEAMAGQSDSHVNLLVHGGKWWDRETGEKALKELEDCRNLIVLYNHILPDIKFKAPMGVTGRRCYRVPCFADPFLPGILVTEWWDVVMGPYIFNKRRGDPLRNYLRKTIGIICRKIGLLELRDLDME